MYQYYVFDDTVDLANKMVCWLKQNPFKDKLKFNYFIDKRPFKSNHMRYWTEVWHKRQLNPLTSNKCVTHGLTHADK